MARSCSGQRVEHRRQNMRAFAHKNFVVPLNDRLKCNSFVVSFHSGCVFFFLLIVVMVVLANFSFPTLFITSFDESLSRKFIQFQK